MASDKSISHRALLFSAFGEGTSCIRNLLQGEDVLATAKILKALGIKMDPDISEWRTAAEIKIHGVGFAKLKTPDTVLDCGNSGTTMRLCLGWLSGMQIPAHFCGDASLSRRPMERVLEPLEKMGAQYVIQDPEKKRVIEILPRNKLKGIDYVSPVASAQVKSALLLAGLYADGKISIREPVVSRDHTEIFLRAMGADLFCESTRVTLTPGKSLSALDLTIPADISSAAFFLVAALIVPNSEIFLEEVNLNPTRTGILEVLVQMGAKIKIENEHYDGGEKVGDLVVSSSPLRGTKVGGAIIPRLIDEIPILALAAAMAEGETVFTDVAELRVKESDRLHQICVLLGELGVHAEEKPDGFTVFGQGFFKTPRAPLKTHLDHRLAMMLVIAGLVTPESFTIEDVSSIATSFPDFFEKIFSLIKG